MRTRTWIAALTAPVIGITAGFVALAVAAWEPVSARSLEWFGWFLLWGVPVALLVEAVVGIPLYRVMHRRNAVRIAPVLIAGVAAGILTVMLPLGFFGGDGATALGLAALTGGIGGFFAATWFWFVSGWGRAIPAA